MTSSCMYCHINTNPPLCHYLQHQCDKNQFGTTKNSKVFHRTVKSGVLDICESFRISLQSDLSLDSLVHESLIFQQQIRGYKKVEPPTKYQKVVPSKLLFHTYSKQKSHLITVIGKLIIKAVFFSMKS